MLKLNNVYLAMRLLEWFYILTLQYEELLRVIYSKHKGMDHFNHILKGLGYPVAKLQRLVSTKPAYWQRNKESCWKTQGTPLLLAILQVTEGIHYKITSACVASKLFILLHIKYSMLYTQDLCHGFWLAESEAVSQTDAITQILVT